jgi:hypothetical protein
MFNRINDKLESIQKNLDKHYEGSDDRRDKMNKLVTDVEVIKTKFESQREYQKDTESGFRWRTGILIGVVTTIVTITINLVTKFFGGK